MTAQRKLRGRQPAHIPPREHLDMAVSYLTLAARHIDTAGDLAGTEAADMLACFASNVLQGSLALIRELRAALKEKGTQDMSTLVERCSCGESEHLRKALRAIMRVAGGVTPGTPVDDMAVINNLADQGLKLERLVGDPGVYSLSRVKRP